MKLNKIIFFALILFLVSSVFSQSFLNRPLSKIIVVGNDHTNYDVIERELLVTRGQLVTDSLVEMSKKRLENLWLFNRVEFYPLDSGDSVSLLISVTERLYIFPFPEYKVEDRDWGKLTYGIGLAHDNFRGRNEKLYGSLTFGYRPGYKFSYYNPWIGREAHLTASFYLQKYTIPNRQEEFDEKHFYLASSLGKYWTRYFYSSFYFFRDDISVKSDFKSFMETGTKNDVNYGFFITNTHDTRDLYAYPGRGHYIQLYYKQGGLFNSDIEYSKIQLDLRQYIPWKKIILAGRFYSLTSTGNLPIYDQVYFGFQERIRGHFTESYSGNHLMFGGLAVRFPILPIHYYSVPSVLLPASSTQNLKFGINGGIFVESGIAWDQREDFKQDNFISGFGAGIHFLLPYIEVLRIDLAFDEKFKNQFIIEIEMPF